MPHSSALSTEFAVEDSATGQVGAETASFFVLRIH